MRMEKIFHSKNVMRLDVMVTFKNNTGDEIINALDYFDKKINNVNFNFFLFGIRT